MRLFIRQFILLCLMMIVEKLLTVLVSCFLSRVYRRSIVRGRREVVHSTISALLSLSRRDRENWRWTFFLIFFPRRPRHDEIVLGLWLRLLSINAFSGDTPLCPSFARSLCSRRRLFVVGRGSEDTRGNGKSLYHEEPTRERLGLVKR